LIRRLNDAEDNFVDMDRRRVALRRDIYGSRCHGDRRHRVRHVGVGHRWRMLASAADEFVRKRPARTCVELAMRTADWLIIFGGCAVLMAIIGLASFVVLEWLPP